MLKMGTDIVQIQRRTNDIPRFKKEHGEKICFHVSLEGVEQGIMPQLTDEELVNAIRETVELYAPGGGAYIKNNIPTPEQEWLMAQEVYCHSRELYDNE